jgi:hypothetical protein
MHELTPRSGGGFPGQTEQVHTAQYVTLSKGCWTRVGHFGLSNCPNAVQGGLDKLND